MSDLAPAALEAAIKAAADKERVSYGHWSDSYRPTIEAAITAYLALAPAPPAEAAEVRILTTAEKMADEYVAETVVGAMMDAAADIFSKWADAGLLARFREQIENIAHLSFVEGIARYSCTTHPPAEAAVAEVRRYSMVEDKDGYAGLFPDPDGDWCAWDDVAARPTPANAIRRAALEEAAQYLEDFAQAYSTDVETGEPEMTEIQECVVSALLGRAAVIRRLITPALSEGEK